MQLRRPGHNVGDKVADSEPVTVGGDQAQRAFAGLGPDPRQLRSVLALGGGETDGVEPGEGNDDESIRRFGGVPH